MKELLQKHQQTFAAKTAERDALMAKGAEITGEDISKANQINEELRGIVSQINDLKKLDGDKSELDSFFKDAASSFNFGGGGSGGPQVLGVQPAGTTTIGSDKKGFEVLQEGQGLFTEKQWKAISDEQYLKAFNMWARKQGNIDGLDSIERKILTEGIDSEGGFFVPAEMLNRIIQKQPAPTRVIGRTQTFRTSKNALVMPKVIYATDDIYTTGIRVRNTGEQPSSSTVHRVTDPVFGQTRIEVGTWMLSMPLTNDLIEDADFPLLSWASGKFGETIDLLFDNQALNGDGVGTNPHGFLKNPGGTDEPAVVVSSTSNDIDPAQLRGMPYELPEQYINDNTCWVMNRASAGKKIATMRAGGSTATDGPFLLLEGQTYPGLSGRTPDQLAGHPIVYSAFMPNIGDGAFPLLFGDLQAYYHVPRIGFSIQMINEVYAEQNYKVMLGRLRFGGKVAEPFRVKVGKSDAS